MKLFLLQNFSLKTTYCFRMIFTYTVLTVRLLSGEKIVCVRRAEGSERIPLGHLYPVKFFLLPNRIRFSLKITFPCIQSVLY